MGLTDRQTHLADQVLRAATAAGSDHLEVLRHLDASPIDKAAVAEYLEGAGAGTEFLLATADSNEEVDQP